MKEIIGVNIKAHRRGLNISLKDLAAKVDVSASFLSQIEKGKVAPSITTLKSLADALDTTVGTLLGENERVTDSYVVRASERRFHTVLKGQRAYVLTAPNLNKQMEPILFEFDRDATSGESLYRHNGQEFVFILDGSLEITLNERKFVLEEGDCIYFNSDIPHFAKNMYGGNTRALWVITPPSF
jgi:transcriptional regulator with XRE-family HTH domain